MEFVEIFIANFNFIFINSFLALIAVIFGWLMLQKYPKLLQMLFGFMWLIFLPNTIYILTDISHLIEDWHKLDNFFKIIVSTQYLIFSIFGIITFVLSTYFFQQLLEGKAPGWRIKHSRFSALFAIFVLNFIVGFGVILGGIQRTNSWHIFTDPLKVIRDVMTLASSSELLILSIGTGLLANCMYFIFAKTIEDQKKLSKSR